MNDFLSDLFNALREYILHSHDAVSDFQFWLYPLITVMLIWFLTTVFTKFLYQNKKEFTYKKTFYIFHAWIISSLIIATIWIAAIIILHIDYFYSYYPVDLRLSHMISLLLALSSAVIAFVLLRKYYHYYNLKEIVNLPLTSQAESLSALRARKTFARTKYWVLLPLLGFTFLLLILRNQGNVYSIIFDNSPSVSPGQLARPKDALMKTIDQMGKDNFFYLTTLKNTEVLSYSTIINTDIAKVNTLNAITATHLDPAACNAFIREIRNDESVVQGSPLTEAMWQNYLFVNNDLESNLIKRKKIQKMIIISDCAESTMDLEPKDIFNTDFGLVFPIDKVKIVDVAESPNFNAPFYNVMVTLLGVETAPGFEESDCESSLRLAMPPFDFFLIFWLVFLYIIAVTVILFVKPAKLR